MVHFEASIASYSVPVHLLIHSVTYNGVCLRDTALLVVAIAMP